MPADEFVSAELAAARKLAPDISARALEFEAEEIPDQRLEAPRLRGQSIHAQIELITGHSGLNLPSPSPVSRVPPKAMRIIVLIRHA